LHRQCLLQKGVLVLQFAGPAQLTRQSFELEELQRAFQQKDTKVLIDLGRVNKIDSAGLGQLMSFYSHPVKNQGILKLLNPTAAVQTLLKLSNA
jgi:anti-sigma B factor antagonist